MRKKFRELGLVYKITLIIVCILVVPTFLIGMFYYRSYKQSLYKEADKKLEESINEVNSSIKECLEDAKSALNDIEYSQELLYFLDGNSVPSERECSVFWEDIQQEWITLRQIYPSLFSYMNLYSSNEQIYSENNWKFKVLSLQEFAAREEAESHEGIWYGDTYSQGSTQESNLNVMDSEDMIFPVYLNIRNVSTDELIGIVELCIPFEKVIASRDLPNKESGVSYIFSDISGETIYSSSNLWVQRPDTLKGDLVSLVDLAEWDGTLYRILEVENEETGIVCTALMEEQKITQSANEMIWQVSVAALIGVLVILVLTYVVIKKMLNRLVVLDQAMKQVETGDFRIHLEKDNYNDEVSRMKRRFQHMADRLGEAMDEAVAREKAQTDAELRALQAQINPHFLFNTIETMRMQCEIDRYYKIGDALMALGEIFRYTIRWKGYEVPFHLEWQNLQNYISLMKLRLDDDFDYEMEWDKELHDVMVPKMFLQPLVENSFQHGFKGVPAPWKLTILASKEQGKLVVRIRDNGCGVPKEKLSQLQESMKTRKSVNEKEDQRQSIGIINVLQRMDRICPKGSDILLGNGEQGGIEIEIKIVLGE